MKNTLFSIGILILTSMFSLAQEATPAAGETKANPNAPEVVFEQTTHDFGTIQKGDECSYEFKFKNAGKEPLILSNCQASCGCTTPVCPKEPVVSGGAGSIKVKYDSNRVGVFSKTISITSNAKNSPVVLTIKGKVDAPAQEEAFPGKNNGGLGK